MDKETNKHLEALINRYPILSICKNDIFNAFKILKECYSKKGKLLICGNGGSAADSEHIVGELMKGFKKQRPLPNMIAEKLKAIDAEKGEVLTHNLQGALPAIALDNFPALNTAYINDCAPLLCFAQQVYGFGQSDDVLWCISTSGNSQNIIYAAITAKSKGMKIIGLTGKTESSLSKISDCCIRVPETETYLIQELHLPVYHCLCLMLEDEFFN